MFFKSFNLARKKTIRRRVSRYRRKNITRTSVKRGGMNLGRVLKRASKQALMLSLARKLVPNIGGIYQSSLDKISAASALKILGQGGSALLEVGIAEAGANLFDTRVVPLVQPAIAQTTGQVQSTASGMATQTYSTIQALYQ